MFVGELIIIPWDEMPAKDNTTLFEILESGRYRIGCSLCRGGNHLGKNFVPPINTRSPVVELVKLMAWRQAKSLMKIPVCWLGNL